MESGNLLILIEKPIELPFSRDLVIIGNMKTVNTNAEALAKKREELRQYKKMLVVVRYEMRELRNKIQEEKAAAKANRHIRKREREAAKIAKREAKVYKLQQRLAKLQGVA